MYFYARFRICEVSILQINATNKILTDKDFFIKHNYVNKTV